MSVEIDKHKRCIFVSAYIHEHVRAGLQQELDDRQVIIVRHYNHNLSDHVVTCDM